MNSWKVFADRLIRRSMLRPKLWCTCGLILLFPVATSLADKPPAFKVTNTPASEKSGEVVKIVGTLNTHYTAYPELSNDTTFDLTEAVWISQNDHPTESPFTAGNQPNPPENIRIIGGVIPGIIPLEWNWTLTHAFGGSAFFTVATGLQVLDGARVHNVHDGWRPRETPKFLPRAYANTGRFEVRNCYMTGIRDDCIENDEFMPGAIEDSLFDGVFTFLSEQNEPLNGFRTLKLPTIGPEEDPNIEITRSLVRLAITNGDEVGPGTWFKFHGYESPNHHLVITDSVFAVDVMPNRGWKPMNFPKNATFKGTNYLLWLGEPGTCKATVPEGVTFVEGQAAKDKWVELRNKWLVEHGYDAQSPDNWNPMTVPVVAPKALGAADKQSSETRAAQTSHQLRKN